MQLQMAAEVHGASVAIATWIRKRQDFGFGRCSTMLAFEKTIKIGLFDDL